jgi:hypothetical protein
MRLEPVEPVTVATTATTSTQQGLPGVGFDIFGAVAQLLGNNETAAGLFTLGGILGVLSVVWSVVVVLGYLIAILFLVLYVYASVRKQLYEELADQVIRDQEDMYDQQYRGVAKHGRLDDVLTHIASENPNDWKLAIIEADIILDDTLKQKGYAGTTLGERLKSISPNQLASLQDAWEAHKVRNRIAHEGSDFVLTKRIAQETITQYRRVFDEFGIR